MNLGVDIVAIDRLAGALTNSGDAFISRVLTTQERVYLEPVRDNTERFAGFWAAKEAAVKALGLGFRYGISFHDIEIVHDEYGCPRYHFSGEFLRLASEKKIQSATLSISHCSTYAVAVAALS